MTDHDAIPTHVGRVVANEAIGERYRRLTIGGLDRFRSVAPDEFVYVLLPPPGRRELTVDEGFRWSAYDAMAEEDRPVGAYYTVRQHRPAAGEVDLDVFLHDEPGPVSGWAPAAQPGDPVALWGPRTAFEPPAEVDWWLLVADETGLPATARILESLPDHARVTALVEIAGASDEQPLTGGPGARVEWVHRDGAAPGRRLVDAVRTLDPPPGRPYVWGGAESRAMAAIRTHVRGELGLEQERVSLTPYWRAPA